MNILGISCYYHDSAAALIRDGEVVAAVQEERFNRRKNSPDFPINAINSCIQDSGITFNDIDYVVFHEKPFLKFYRVILNHLLSYPLSLGNFLLTTPQWLEDRLIIPLKVKEEIGFEGDVLFLKHHLSHAASSFLVSPFEEAAILTVDGVGEWATASVGIGRGINIDIAKEIFYPDSLGLLYGSITTYLGFEALRGEGKVMGLAAYGQPEYIDKLREIVEVGPDGSFKMNQRFFGFNKGSRMYSRKLVKAFGKPRKPGEEISERHQNIAASLQKFLEETLVKIAGHVYATTKMDNLCLAGGVALNCVANSKILENTGFKNIFIQYLLRVSRWYTFINNTEPHPF